MEDSDGNVNHSVSITWCWIYDSNYKTALPLMRQSLDIMCSPSRYEKCMHAEFKSIFDAVRHEKPLDKPSKMSLANKWYLVMWKNIYIYIYEHNLVILCLLEWKIWYYSRRNNLHIKLHM